MSRRQFGPDGCLVRVGDRTCGEKESLQIIQQFKRLYESKLQQIEDEAGGGDCLPGLQAKVSLQREWIRDLTQQNELLVRAVEELEQEASNRVAMLEQKLEMSVRKGSEVMQKYRDFNFSNKLNEPSHKVEPALHSDSRKLESMQHSDSQRVEPMRPSDSQRRELMQHSDSHRLEPMPHRDSQKSGSMAQYDTGELEPTLRSDSQRFEPMLHNDSQGLDMMLHSDSQRLGSMSHRDSHRGSRKSEPMVRSDARKLVEMLRSDVHSLIEFIRRVRDEGSWSVCGLHFYTVCADSLLGNCKPGECPCVEDEGLQNKIKTVEELEAKRQMLENMEDKLKGMPSQEDVDNIAAKLQATEEELIAVKRSTMDMRNALTIEVADKHDIILNLRRDVQQLEEQCRQSNKQTQFKDDIIKELRKEIKQLKAEVQPVEIPILFENYQDYYPYVRNLHALDLKINNYPLQSKILSCKSEEDIYKEKDSKGKEPFIFIRENPSAAQSVHKNSSLVFIKEQLGIESYNQKPSQLSQTNNEMQRIALSQQSSVMDVQSNLLHLINFPPVCKQSSELLRGLNCVMERYKLFTRSKPRGKLTAKTILHEYYSVKHQTDMYGVVENFTETPKKNFVSVPDHVPVKIFVTNLERNVKTDTCVITKRYSKKDILNGDSWSRNSI